MKNITEGNKEQGVRSKEQGVRSKGRRWTSFFLIPFSLLLIPFLISFAGAATNPHPRIYLTPEVLAELQAKVANNDADWVALKKAADRILTWPVLPYDPTNPRARLGNYITYDYSGGGWYDAFVYLGLAYQMTHNPAYVEKIKEVLRDATASATCEHTSDPYRYDPYFYNKGFPARSAIYSMGLAYDWTYDQLDAATKQQVITAFNTWFDCYLDPANAGPLYQTNGPGEGNYFGGHVLGLGVAGLATLGDNPRAPEMVAHMRSLFDENVPKAFADIFSGGYAIESYNYGHNHYIRLFNFLLAMKTATGDNMLETYQPYMKSVARNLIYNLKPNRWQSSDEGDYPGSLKGVMPGNIAVILSRALRGTTEGGWMQFFYENRVAPPYDIQTVNYAAPFQWGSLEDKFLQRSRNRSLELDYRLSLPLYLYSPGDEHAYHRSSWADDAVWVSYRAGSRHLIDHQAFNAGHFAIQRGNDYIMPYTGQWAGRSPSGAEGSPTTFDLTSWRSNTLFFNDFGEYHRGYPGGQGNNGADHVLAHQEDNRFVYAKSDLTSAYDQTVWLRDDAKRALRYFYRSFVSLGDGMVVLYDRVRALKPTYVKKLYFHFNYLGTPQINGKTITSSVGQSRLFMKTLLPDAPTYEVNADSATEPGEFVAWRAEVSDSAGGTDLDALHVISTTDQSVSAMPTTVRIDAQSNTMVGSHIASTPQRVVLFSKGGAYQQSVTYTASVTGLARHLVVDMEPGDYDLTVDGSRIGSVVAPRSGALSFDYTGGRTFRLQQTRALPNSLNIEYFTATPQPSRPGTPVIISWTITGGTPTSMSFDRGIGSILGASYVIVKPTTTTTYTLTASNASGSTSRSITVLVEAPPDAPVISSFKATPAAINPGQSSVLSWTLSGVAATSLDLSPDVGSVTGRLQASVSPARTTTYTLRAFSATGSVGAKQVTVVVNGTTPLPPPGTFSLEPPNLSGLNGRTFRVNEEVGFTYAGSATEFEWEIVSGSEQQAAGSKQLTAARFALSAAGLGAPTQTQAPRFNLGTQNLTPGNYTLRVRAMNGSLSSAWASANISLVLADLNAVRIYPNPWRSDRHTGDITFDNLSLGSTIKIFNTAGHLVRELSTQNSGLSTQTWDRKNDKGDKVASGVYIFLIKDASGSERKGKVALIK